MPDPPDAKNRRGPSAPIVESYLVLPLWRRVDKHFWWNEWMSKPFIDAGVCSFFICFSVFFFFFCRFVLLN